MMIGPGLYPKIRSILTDKCKRIARETLGGYEMNTKITGTAVLVCQWIQAAAVASQAGILISIFEQYAFRPPFPAYTACWLFNLPVLMTITILLSAGLVASELFVKSERTRLRIQFAYLGGWTTVVILLMASMVQALTEIPAQGAI